MAEGLLRHLYGEKYEVFSAGSSPTQVNPLAIKVMAEIGIDISKQYSKSIEEFRKRDIDLVVSVCKSSAKLLCALCSSPIIGDRPEIIAATLPRAKRYTDHGFSDPYETEGTVEQKMEAFRRTRDEIRKYITETFADLKTRDSDSNP
jgi:arsenate reductase